MSSPRRWPGTALRMISINNNNKITTSSTNSSHSCLRGLIRWVQVWMLLSMSLTSGRSTNFSYSRTDDDRHARVLIRPFAVQFPGQVYSWQASDLDNLHGLLEATVSSYFSNLQVNGQFPTGTILDYILLGLIRVNYTASSSDMNATVLSFTTGVASFLGAEQILVQNFSLPSRSQVQTWVQEAINTQLVPTLRDTPYAYVKQATYEDPSSSPLPDTNATNTTTTDPNGGGGSSAEVQQPATGSSSRVDWAPLMGGVVGGSALLLLTVSAAVIAMRRRRQRTAAGSPGDQHHNSKELMLTEREDDGDADHGKELERGRSRKRDSTEGGAGLGGFDVTDNTTEINESYERDVNLSYEYASQQSSYNNVNSVSVHSDPSGSRPGSRLPVPLPLPPRSTTPASTSTRSPPPPPASPAILEEGRSSVSGSEEDFTVDTEAGDSLAIKSLGTGASSPASVQLLTDFPVLTAESFERERKVNLRKDMLTTPWSGRVSAGKAVQTESVLQPSHFTASQERRVRKRRGTGNATSDELMDILDADGEEEFDDRDVSSLIFEQADAGSARLSSAGSISTNSEKRMASSKGSAATSSSSSMSTNVRLV